MFLLKRSQKTVDSLWRVGVGVCCLSMSVKRCKGACRRRCVSVYVSAFHLWMLSVVRPLRVHAYVPERARAFVCSGVVDKHGTKSAGKLSLSSERFQARSTMKAQWCDTRGAAHTTASASPLIITLYQSMSHLAIFLSVSIPPFSLWNLSISHVSIIPGPLILHSSHSSSFRQQPSSLSRQRTLFFLFLLLFFNGWGLTGSYGSFRSSQLRCPSHVPEELGWCKPILQIFPHNRCNAHTCTHTPITLTHSRHLVLTAHCLLPMDLPGSAFATRLQMQGSS